MIRKVDLVSYLPQFLQDYAEITEALKAEDLEFALVWEAADRVFKNRFIETADEYGISRLENILGIYPSVEDSLEDRRTRVRLRWYSKIYYTERMLRKMLDDILGKDRYTLDILHDINTVEVRIKDQSRVVMKSVAELLEEVIPLDQLICLILQKEISMHLYAAVKTIAGVHLTLHDNGKEVLNRGKTRVNPHIAVKSFADLRINIYDNGEEVHGSA